MSFTVRVLAAAVLASSASFASGVPSRLVYQGRLLKADGSPVTQNLTITFALYETATAGAPLWSEEHSVDPSDGFFEVVLGDSSAGVTASSQVPLDAVVDGRELWLGITAGSDPEMAPRTPLASAPYALLATPVSHAQTHMKGGGDEIASYDAAADRIPMAGPSGALDPGWVPLLPLAKGGTGTATPQMTRNLCVYLAAPTDLVPAPTIPVAPDLGSCIATRAFGSARVAPNVTFTFATSAGPLFPDVSWAGGTRVDSALPNAIALAPGAVVWPVISGETVFRDATYCLQVKCEASF
jgi:hypothetical protein